LLSKGPVRTAQSTLFILVMKKNQFRLYSAEVAVSS